MSAIHFMTACLLVSLLCGIANANQNSSCGRWIGFDLDDSMDFKIIVSYTHCDGRPQKTIPFGPKTTYPQKPDPFIAAFDSELTIYDTDDLETPLLQVNTGHNASEGMIIGCSGGFQGCTVERP